MPFHGAVRRGCFRAEAAEPSLERRARVSLGAAAIRDGSQPGLPPTLLSILGPSVVGAVSSQCVTVRGAYVSEPERPSAASTRNSKTENDQSDPSRPAQPAQTPAAARIEPGRDSVMMGDGTCGRLL